MRNKQTQQLNKVSYGLILLGLSLAIFITSIDTNIVAVCLPTIVKALHTSFLHAQWVILSYLLSITIFIVGIGRIGDMFGKKWLYLSGILIFTVSSLLCGLSSSVYVLIGFRFLQGVGAAILMAMSFALAGDFIAEDKIASAMGILTSMLTLGIALGPSVGGILISWFGWRVIFLINIPIGIAAFIIGLKFPNLKISPVKKLFDWFGLITLALALICYDLAITMSESQGFSFNVKFLSIVAVISIVGFIFIENKVPSPLIDLRIFKNRIISGSLGISVILYAMINTISFVLPFFLAYAQGLPTFEIGLLIATGALATTIMSPFAGKAAEKFGNRPVMILGMMGFGTGCFLMSTLTQASSPMSFAVRIAISNGSFAFFQTPNNTAIISSASSKNRGVISGLLNLARILGQTTGAALMGAVFNYFIASKSVSKDVYSFISASPAAIVSGVHGTFIIAVLAVIIAIGIGLITLRQNQ